MKMFFKVYQLLSDSFCGFNYLSHTKIPNMKYCKTVFQCVLLQCGSKKCDEKSLNLLPLTCFHFLNIQHKKK
jgi:hypothetical protein